MSIYLITAYFKKFAVKPILIFLVLITGYHIIFKNFFPTTSGTVGHDFSLALPGTYDGFLWFINNSIFTPPWFTPSFCGGVPNFADPQSGYYSLPQFLGFIVSPLKSAYLTVLISAALGYWGFYRLMRRTFDASVPASILAGALFMFNSFLSLRSLVGEYGFHGIMLVPLIASLLIAPAKNQSSRPSKQANLTASVFAGLLIAYWLQSGLTTLIIPSALSVVAVACIAFILDRADWRSFLLRSTIASILALAISASKLVASWAFFGNFPRTQYSMPGIEGIGNTIWLIVQALFFSSEGATRQANPLIRNMQWSVLPHEWAYSLSIVPLVILLAGLAGLLIMKNRGTTIRINLKSSSIFSLTIFLIIIIIPISLLVYSPSWNNVLKSIPLINATAWPFRWTIIYIPILVVITALIFDWIPFIKRYSYIMLYTLLTLMLLQNIFEPRDYYSDQSKNNLSYDPSIIENAFNQVKSTSIAPPITQIVVIQDTEGNVIAPLSRNDAVAFGFSQLYCYNPIFGYGLEKFPIKSLQPGPALEQQDGILNIKNPACYVFPKENHCEPGDHFTVNDYDRAQAFVEYRPWYFEKSLKQKVADYVTMISLALAITVLLFWIYGLVRNLSNKFGTSA